jgi:hypothetical protein
MDAELKYAVLSFCTDLTDPKATSKPVAIVGVGDGHQDQHQQFWFCVVCSAPGDMLDLANDPVSRSVLNDLPTLLEQQMRAGVTRVGAANFLPWLHDRFRNSLHVSAFHETTQQYQHADELVAAVVRLYQQLVPEHASTGWKLPWRRTEPRSVPAVRLEPFPVASADAAAEARPV